MNNQHKDIGVKSISNVHISNECYKKLKIISMYKDERLQQVISEILEKVTSKQLNNIKSVDEMIKSG